MDTRYLVNICPHHVCIYIYFTYLLLYFIFYILYFIFYILYFIFYILYFIFYILYFIFYILYFIFYILYVLCFMFYVLCFIFYILYFIFCVYNFYLELWTTKLLKRHGQASIPIGMKQNNTLVLCIRIHFLKGQYIRHKEQEIDLLAVVI